MLSSIVLILDQLGQCVPLALVSGLVLINGVG